MNGKHITGIGHSGSAEEWAWGSSDTSDARSVHASKMEMCDSVMPWSGRERQPTKVVLLGKFVPLIQRQLIFNEAYRPARRYIRKHRDQYRREENQEKSKVNLKPILSAITCERR